MGEQRAFIPALGMVINGGSANVSWQEQGVLPSAVTNLCLHARGGAALIFLLCSQVRAQLWSWWAHGRAACCLPRARLHVGSPGPASETTLSQHSEVAGE